MHGLLYLLLFLSPAWPEQIVLQVGESRLIEAAPTATVRVKNAAVISVEDHSNGIRVTGKAPGQATVTMGREVHTVIVQRRSAQLFYRELQELLAGFKGLKSLGGATPVITGRLHRLSDWQAIANLAKRHAAHYEFAAEPDADLIAEAASLIRKALSEAGHQPLPVRFSPKAIVHAPAQLKQHEGSLQSALRPWGVSVAYEEGRVSVSPLVRVKIVVAEINRAFQRELGFDWPDEISAQVAGQGKVDITVLLRMMEEKGEGQILASPSLLARSGGTADFLAGGEFGVKVVSRSMREVHWKRHGIYLQIKPVADRSGALSIELSTEISLIDGSQTIEGVPALKTNRMSTHFDMSVPRTIVLSGLIRNDWSHSRSQVPLLGDIPVLGALFRSDNFNKRKSELVIFVTPEIVSENDSVRPDMPKGWKSHDD